MADSAAVIDFLREDHEARNWLILMEFEAFISPVLNDLVAFVIEEHFKSKSPAIQDKLVYVQTYYKELRVNDFACIRLLDLLIILRKVPVATHIFDTDTIDVALLYCNNFILCSQRIVSDRAFKDTFAIMEKLLIESRRELLRELFERKYSNRSLQDEIRAIEYRDVLQWLETTAMKEILQKYMQFLQVQIDMLFARAVSTVDHFHANRELFQCAADSMLLVDQTVDGFTKQFLGNSSSVDESSNNVRILHMIRHNTEQQLKHSESMEVTGAIMMSKVEETLNSVRHIDDSVTYLTAQSAITAEIEKLKQERCKNEAKVQQNNSDLDELIRSLSMSQPNARTGARFDSGVDSSFLFSVGSSSALGNGDSKSQFQYGSEPPRSLVADGHFLSTNQQQPVVEESAPDTMYEDLEAAAAAYRPTPPSPAAASGVSCPLNQCPAGGNQRGSSNGPQFRGNMEGTAYPSPHRSPREQDDDAATEGGTSTQIKYMSRR